MASAVILMAILSCGLHMVRGDTNDKWQPNDNLLRIIDDFYDELVSQTHVFTQRQRYLAIVTLTISYYISSHESVSNSRRIENSVEKTRKQLGQSTEAIGSIMEELLALLRSIIDKPINDIKECCPPKIGQAACDECLQKIQARNEQYCKGYSNNVKHYNEVVALFNDKQIQDLVAEINTTKSITDSDALRFFSNAANGKYSKPMKSMRDQYQKQIHTSYPCNALNVPPFLN